MNFDLDNLIEKMILIRLKSFFYFNSLNIQKEDAVGYFYKIGCTTGDRNEDSILYFVPIEFSKNPKDRVPNELITLVPIDLIESIELIK